MLQGIPKRLLKEFSYDKTTKSWFVYSYIKEKHRQHWLRHNKRSF